MTECAHDEHVDGLLLDRLGDDVFRIAGDQRGGHIEARGLQGGLGPIKLLGCVLAFLSRHQQGDWQATEQRAACDHFDATPGHGTTVEGDHHALRLFEAFGHGQDRFVQGPHYLFHIAAQVALCGSVAKIGGSQR